MGGIEALLLPDCSQLIKLHSVDLDQAWDINCPYITHLDDLFKQQRFTPIRQAVLDLRDQVFLFRGLHAFTIAQFVEFWSFYDGFVRKSSQSAKGDKIVFQCNWRGCPATYTLDLLTDHQFVVLSCSEEHFHAVMDSVHQLPLCTMIRYQALDAITATEFASTSQALELLKELTSGPLYLRAGLDRISTKYIEQLSMRLKHAPPLELPPSKRFKK